MQDENKDARPVDETEWAQREAESPVRTNLQVDDGVKGDSGMPLFADATAMAEAGYQLIPLRPHDKIPLDREWTTRPYDATEVLRLGEASVCNIGVRMRPIDLVIDVDPRNGGDESLVRLIKDADLDLSHYPQVATGGGGHHYYLLKPADLPISARLPAYPGIDFKKLGGQVVAPGSIHPNGLSYVASFHLVGPADTPDAPPALLNLLSIERHSGGSAPGELTPELLEVALQSIPVEDFGTNEDWLQLMMACHHATAGAGVDEFIAWSIGDPNFAGSASEIRSRWMSLDSDGSNKVTIATLVRILNGYGAHLPREAPENDFDLVDSAPESGGRLSKGRKGKPDNSFANCLAALQLADDQLGLSFDEFGQVPLLRAKQLPWQVDVGREINDDVVRLTRYYLLERFDLEAGKDHVVESMLTLARAHPFHPVRDYLTELSWDGVPRLDSLLVKYAGAEDNDYNRAIGSKTLIAAVRRVRSPGCKFDYVVVLEGPQGSWKSTFVRELAPKPSWYSDPAFGSADSKDAALLLQGTWIIELGEMSVLSKSDVEALKAFVSRGVDKLRRPYERLVSSLPRQCIFIGTTNQSEYLMDQTGNRRFWPVRVGQIDIESLILDRDQIWAEAASREANGESIELPKDLWEIAAKQAKERVSEDPWASLLRDYLNGSSSNTGIGPIEPINRIHTRELLSNALCLSAVQQTPAVPRRLRMVMEKQLGWNYAPNVRIGDKQGAGYTRPTEG